MAGLLPRMEEQRGRVYTAETELILWDRVDRQHQRRGDPEQPEGQGCLVRMKGSDRAREKALRRSVKRR